MKTNSWTGERYFLCRCHPAFRKRPLFVRMTMQNRVTVGIIRTKPKGRRVPQKPITAIPTRDDRASQETKGNVVGGANGPEYRVRTGSNLPEHYNRRGYSTDSRDNSTIYDKNDIRLQHTNSVHGCLA